MVSFVKLPILKKGEYILWTMKMEQYLAHTDYALWEQILARTRERKAKSTLLMAIPDEHLARFNGIKDAKTLWVAIKTRFGDKGYDRFQRPLSLLEIHGASVSTEDANQKFHRSLSSAWSNISLIMRNKPGIDNLDIDDLYNNLKVHEADIKGSYRSSLNSQNVAFVFAESTSSTNELNAAYSVSTATSHSSQAQGSSSYVDELMFSFFANQSNTPHQYKEDLEKIDQDDLEEMDLKWDCRSARNSGNMSRDAANAGYIGRNNEEEVNDFALMAFTLNPSSSSSSISKREKLSKANIEIIEEEMTETVFDNLSSDEENSVANDMYKKGEGYHAVPPPLTGNYMPPKPGLLETDSDDDSVITPEPIPAKIDFVKADRMVKQSVLPTNVGKGTGHKESKPVWNNVQRINHQNKFAPTAVFTRSSRIPVSAAKPKATASTSAAKPVDTAGPKQSGHPQQALKNKGIVDSGCSMHMTWNKAYLADYQEIHDGGFVAFGSSRDKITGKVTYDFSRFSWVFFLATKDETSKGSRRNIAMPELHNKMELQKKKNRTFIETHNKTRYELLDGRSPRLDFIRPFGCSVTILNTLDPLEKFEGKADEGFLFGYSVTSKAFRDNESRKRKLVMQRMPLESTNSFNTVSNPVNAASTSRTFSAGGPSSPHLDVFIPANTLLHVDQDDSQIPELEETAKLQSTSIFNSAYNDDLDIYTSLVQSVDTEADFNNMESSTIINHVPTYKVHIDDPKDQVLGDSKLAVQIRGMAKKSSEAHALVSYIHKQRRTNHKDYENCLFACFLSQIEPKKKVWKLVDLPYRKKDIGTKWVYGNNKEERGIVVRNKARLIAQGHRQKERIDYDEVFALVARIEAIGIFLAFATFIGFIVYQIDEKDDIMLVQVYVDDIIFGSTKKSLCGEFEALMHKRFQISSMWELTFFLGLQCKKHTIVATSTTKAEYIVAAHCCGQCSIPGVLIKPTRVVPPIEAAL
nr:hypothetical protein [Tanacetum cinerariifolium]